MSEGLQIFFAAFGLFLTLFLFCLALFLNKKEKLGEAREKRAEQREEAVETMLCLILRGVKKTGQLAYATAVAYVDGEVNGEMTEARKDYKECMSEIDKHLENQAFKK